MVFDLIVHVDNRPLLRAIILFGLQRLQSLEFLLLTGKHSLLGSKVHRSCWSISSLRSSLAWCRFRGRHRRSDICLLVCILLGRRLASCWLYSPLGLLLLLLLLLLLSSNCLSLRSRLLDNLFNLLLLLIRQRCETRLDHLPLHV